MKCPNGHQVNRNAKFCPTCGAIIKDNGKTVCKKCGNEQKEGEKFCSQCGTPYESSSIPTTKKSSKYKVTIIASLVAVATLIVAIGHFLWFSNNNKYSLEGLARITYQYDIIDNFHDGLALVKKGDKIGFIDRMGNEVIPCIYDENLEFNLYSRYSFSEGIAIVSKGEELFAIDKKGIELFVLPYDIARSFSEGMCPVCKNEKWGFIDTSGKEVINCDYDSATEFINDFTLVSKDGLFGYLDKRGKVVIPLIYESANVFHDERAAVGKNGKYGYIDAKGNVVIPLEYQSVGTFNGGIATVIKDEKYAHINVDGKIVSAFFDDKITTFYDGVAWIKWAGKYAAINNDYDELFTGCYQDVYNFVDGVAFVEIIGSKDVTAYRLIDKQGKSVNSVIFDNVLDFSEGLAAVCKDGIWGYIDTKGKSTFDVMPKEAAQIKEKIRKEQEKKEEERRKLEEIRKNEAAIEKFNSFAKKENIVWVFGKEYTEKSDRYRIKISEVLYFHPNNEHSGRVSYVQYLAKFNYDGGYTWLNRDDEFRGGYYPDYSGTASYTINNGVICVNMITKNAYTQQSEPLILEITESASLIRQSNGAYFRRQLHNFRDPLY